MNKKYDYTLGWFTRFLRMSDDEFETFIDILNDIGYLPEQKLALDAIYAMAED